MPSACATRIRGAPTAAPPTATSFSDADARRPAWAGASDIWITQIYQIAFGRIRFGIASAYSVILFFVMVVIGYYYVKALTSGDEKRRGS